ncbi:MAG: N-acetylmuramoyl-L-alanine amidase [Candidatus Cloacimonetes bacterium HGW-Cloacimonetes-1]|jgi:N-acetylmuramoyl-L-alanine amidase|nr:MAG: N-acetylmuramoyl-L-alanine amidase [Candidatus Cloacimonetes bacterium HGW-Cloacimonetes-1]
MSLSLQRKLIIVLLSIVLPLISLNALSVVVKKPNKTSSTVNLATRKINQIEYVNLDDVNSIFKSVTKEERNDKRVLLYMYGEQFIFLLDSGFYTFKADDFRLPYPVIRENTSYFVPLVFVEDMLPSHFSGDVAMRGKDLVIKEGEDHGIRTIVIDPGHGGKDPGAVGRKLCVREKDVNMNVALKLKKMLEKELGVTVLLTRPDDRFVSLQERTKYANDARADLFISLHSNSSKASEGKGIEVYYLSTARTTEARAVEALENSVVEEFEGGKKATAKYDDLSIILSDILQAEHLEGSNTLATQIQQNLIAGTKAHDRGVKQANFYVLRGAFMPSVLIEMGFVSNPMEEQLLACDEYQDRMARTILEGIKRFKYRYDKIRNA